MKDQIEQIVEELIINLNGYGQSEEWGGTGTERKETRNRSKILRGE